MADEQKKLPEQQTILEGIPLNERQIRSEARRRLKEFKLSVWYEEQKRQILQEQKQIRSSFIAAEELLSAREYERMKNLFALNMRELTAREYLQLRNMFQDQLKKDLSRFLVLSEDGERTIREAVTRVLDECIMEELLTDELLTKYRNGYDGADRVEMNNMLRRTSDVKDVEYVVVPKTARVGDLNALLYGNVKVFIVTERGMEDKRMVWVVRQISLHGINQNATLTESGALLPVSEPLSPEEAHKFVQEKWLEYYPIINEFNEFDGVVSREELESIVRLRTQRLTATLHAQVDIGKMLNTARNDALQAKNRTLENEAKN